VTSKSFLRRWSRSAQVRTAIIVAAAVLCCGCSSSVETAGVPTRRFIPSPEAAQAALEAVLADWQGGRPRELIERLEVKVFPIDNQRKPGQELDSFEILGEVPYEGARCFAVRLGLTHPAADQKVRYVILGIDPLYVYRQEDFELLNHWDHMMPTDSAAKSEGDASAGAKGSATEDTERPPSDAQPGAPPEEQPAATEKPEESPAAHDEAARSPVGRYRFAFNNFQGHRIPTIGSE